MVMKKKGDANFGVAGRLGAMGGKYGRKATNLSAKELKAAGGAKAASKRTVDISKTKRATSGPMAGKTLGPAGKPLTGTVTMPDGSKAVYKDGKRVVKATPTKSASVKAAPTKSRAATPKATTSNKSETPSKPKATGNKRTNRLAGERYEAQKGQTRGTSATTQNKASSAKKGTPSNLTGFSVNKPGSVAYKPGATIKRQSAQPEKQKPKPKTKPSGPMTWGK